jgi:CTP:phosphocholine cytidylyltransferase-like protein
MLFGALVEVFGVPCVEATIHTLQNVNIEGHV